MDFLNSAWNTIKSTAKNVAAWAIRSPVDDFKAGYNWGRTQSTKVNTAVARAVSETASAAGKTIAGGAWSFVLPLIPIIVIVGAGWYFLRRRGA